tara:strand:- start:322 stop:699 length:378 start_codon:yes stop_codon:yes gene_type:complete
MNMRKLRQEIEKTLKFEIEMNANVAEPNGNTQGWVEALEYVLGQIDALEGEEVAEVKRLKKELAYYTDNCTVVWMPEDVLSLDDTLTDEQVSWVLGMMERKSAPEISWDTIEFWISEVKKEGEEE